MYAAHPSVGEALESAVAISNRDKAEVWVGRDGDGFFVCAYRAFPERAEIVCVVSAFAALSKLWNMQTTKRRSR